MTSNNDFLGVIKNSFALYLEAGSSRSTAKLKPLHGQIARDLREVYEPSCVIKSQGYNEGKEARVNGRYYDKMIDITVMADDIPIAGYGVKFIMRNYSQNSNNYFENMLGETANLRASNLPYFQIFITFDKVPHFKQQDKFSHYDKITGNNLKKYMALSMDNPGTYFHVPNKTLLCIVKLKEQKTDYPYRDFNEYAEYYKGVLNDCDLMTYDDDIEDTFSDSVILNNYEDFVIRSASLSYGLRKI